VKLDRSWLAGVTIINNQKSLLNARVSGLKQFQIDTLFVSNDSFNSIQLYFHILSITQNEKE
jgi:hypothetical protein